MSTAEQYHLIETLRRLVEAEPGVEAAWLAGSLGKGGGDEFSDVDLLLLVGEGAAAMVSAALIDGLNRVTKPVLVYKLFGGRVVSVVTDDWERFDLSIVGPADLAGYNSSDLTCLFNRSGREPPLRADALYQASPETLLKLVQEFLRVLGMLPGALGREEYELGLRGVDLLRGMTLDLMLEESGISPAARGGALRRRPFLTADQLQDLETIPAQAAERRSLLDANRTIAAIFLPRARRLAATIGMAWPAAFEEATRRHLKRRLQLEI